MRVQISVVGKILFLLVVIVSILIFAMKYLEHSSAETQKYAKTINELGTEVNKELLLYKNEIIALCIEACEIYRNEKKYLEECQYEEGHDASRTYLIEITCKGVQCSKYIDITTCNLK